MRDGFAVDKWLLLAVAALAALGVTMVLSTSYLYAQERFGDGTYFLRKQLLAMGAGLAALIVCSLVPATTYRRLAYSMAKKEEMIRTFSVGVLPHLIVAGGVLGALLLEPDFGTALILTMLLYLMLFVGGALVHHLLATGLMALPVLIYAMLKAEYRLRRLMTFMDPWREASSSGFQVIQSLIAFGSGQLWGRGLGESRQKLFYLPEAHTDFVFSVIGEELGLLGALVVLALFGVIIARGLRLTSRIEEPFDQYLAFGLTVLLGLQAFIHMGVVMGLMPTKGLVLPFISYGGSAMVINLMEAGILLGLSRRRL